MEFLVAYDVSTETAEGRKRLRKVAQVCEAHGQRVQKSVFECTLNAAELEVLMHRLWRVMEPREDSLRVYRLREPRQRYMRLLGTQPQYDLHEPLVV
jgi:CRISPR-associated protein Cas2